MLRQHDHAGAILERAQPLAQFASEGGVRVEQDEVGRGAEAVEDLDA